MSQTTVQKREKSVVEITSSIPADVFASYEAKALARIGERMELPGFRKGKAPADIIKKNVNEMMLLEEMAELAIYDAYPKILEAEKIDAIGRPEISITKIAAGNDLEFIIVTAVLPALSLPDYKKIAKNENKNDEHAQVITINDEEVEKVLNDLRKMRAHQNMPPHEHQDGEEHAHPELSEEELPPLDDEFAKSFKQDSLDALKEKVRENLKLEKETGQKDKKRMAIVEAILKDTTGDIPEILIHAETEKMLYRLEADITNMGFKMDEYLTQIGKTTDDLKKEWAEEGEKRAKLQLVLQTISTNENLKPEQEEIEKEAVALTKMYKDADPIRAQAYVEQMMTNEKVFTFLESQN